MSRNIPEDHRFQYADLRCFGMLRSLYLVTDVSAQLFGIIITSLDPIYTTAVLGTPRSGRTTSEIRPIGVVSLVDATQE